MDPFVAEIRIFTGNFAPTGWALCDGQLLPIAQNTALFSLLGTIYGGNGQTTFALPDLRGRVGMHFSNGHVQGESAGEETHALTPTEMPVHHHDIGAGADESTNRPGGAIAARGGVYTSASGRTGSMSPTDNA